MPESSGAPFLFKMETRNKIIFASLAIATICLTGCKHKVPVTSNNAHIEFEDTLYDYGKVTIDGSKEKHSFVFHNRGSEPLVINKVATYCGCTEADYSPKSPILAGEEGKVTVTFNPKGETPYNFEKGIIVFSNAENGSQSLTVKGELVWK